MKYRKNEKRKVANISFKKLEDFKRIFHDGNKRYKKKSKKIIIKNKKKIYNIRKIKNEWKTKINNI